MKPLTIEDVYAVVRNRYRPSGLLSRLMLLGRPKACPFHTLADFVPPQSTVLDVGCGNGLFLNLLDNAGRIRSAVGFDVSYSAIDAALRALGSAGDDAHITFRQIPTQGEWPAGEFDVVSMIDVMHHVRPAEQHDAFSRAARKVKPGGMLLYKDMSTRSLWRACANRIHDLVAARQWIRYVGAEAIKAWALEAGFALVEERTFDMLWYKHELMVFRRPSA